jgi:hypothetical protein
MIRFRTLLAIVAVALVGAGILGSPSRANAAFAVRYSTDGVNWTTVNDDVGPATQPPFGDFNPLAGHITALFNGATITASSVAATATSFASIDLAVSGQPTGPLEFFIQAGFTGINTAPAPQTLHFSFTSSTTTPTGSNTITQIFRTWIDNNNGLFGTTGGGIVLDTGDKTVPPGGGSVTGNQSFNGTVPYSITTQMHVTIGGEWSPQLSNDSNNSITPAPAPASLLLVACGAPVFGIGAFLRRRKLIVA